MKVEIDEKVASVDDLIHLRNMMKDYKKNVRNQQKKLSLEIYSKIGANIFKARTSFGISQNDLADCLGLHRTSIIHIEKGKQRLPIHSLCVIAKTLNTTVSELLFGI